MYTKYISNNIPGISVKNFITSFILKNQGKIHGSNKEEKKIKLLGLNKCVN